MGAERSFLGYPVTDEQPATNLGRFSAFAGGLIYWHPNVGAHAIYGEIGKKWLQLGAQRSSCGYPTGDEEDFDDGRDGTTYGYGLASASDDLHSPKDRFFGRKRDTKCMSNVLSKRPRSTCNFTAVAANKQCLNADGTPSSLQPGGTTGARCGSDATRAQTRAKLVLTQAVCLTDGNTPQPGCCTFSVQTTSGCACR
jgi:hypothetical protein